MAAFSAMVTLYDEDGRTIVIEYAYGNTKRTVEAAAGALRRQLEIAYEETHPGCNGIIGRTVKG